MKTYAYTNTTSDILGIGMIYFENGSLLPEVAKLVLELGEDAGILTYGEKVKPHKVVAGVDLGPDPDINVIVVATSEMPGGGGLGYDKTLCNAFKYGGGRSVVEDLAKAKVVTHEKRRAKRSVEFAPLDIQVTIPGKEVAAEAARQAIRDKYAALQVEIDACTDCSGLKAIIKRESL